MRLCCITFTQEGLHIAERIKKSRQHEADIFFKDNYKNHLKELFDTYEGVVFIASTGIAVRLSAPFLSDKKTDPAIVVIDDLGRYCISLVSGHLGGANRLSLELSELLECQPVITTASDGRGIEAVDLFAKRNDLYIESMEEAKKLTAMMIEGKRIRLESELEIKPVYSNLVEDEAEGILFVTSRQSAGSDLPHCILRPKNIHIGLGCRRGKSGEEILKAIQQVCGNRDISQRSIKSIATVDVKGDEAGIHVAAQALGCPVQVFDRGELAKVEQLFDGSSFVKTQIGVGSVCEPCAYLAGGSLLFPKTVISGITIAVSREGLK